MVSFDQNSLNLGIKKNVLAYIFQFGKFAKEGNLKMSLHILPFLTLKKHMPQFQCSTFLQS